MKKIFKNACLLTLCAATLVGCGNSKVEFATFKTKAEEALKKTVEYTNANVSGTVKYGSTTTSVNFKATLKNRALTPESLSDAVYTTAINAFDLKNVVSTSESELKDYEYYAGSTFEMKYVPSSSSSSSETSISNYFAWNEYGLLTTFTYALDDSNSMNFTISYSK